ncbi:MarR family winged helix-turn-helix transcriptional regulator [Daeguia caeni]|uniref:MarR family winged helix-turn-helix transcriptional regulator n=1 Tax=Daeguia caeni TaxID=439612 RepID=A0ABV9H9K0_9HYPH
MSKTLPDPDSFGFLLMDVARLYRAEVDRRIGNAGLDITPAEARTLVHAARHGPVRQTVLAERMGIEAMTLCGYLDGLEAHGLIVRVADPDDRRAKQIHLTDAAEPALQVILNISKDIRAAVSRSMSAQEWDAINALLKSIRNNLAEAAPDCSPSHMDSHKK